MFKKQTDFIIEILRTTLIKYSLNMNPSHENFTKPKEVKKYLISLFLKDDYQLKLLYLTLNGNLSNHIWVTLFHLEANEMFLTRVNF